jgi:hypothetical protein
MNRSYIAALSVMLLIVTGCGPSAVEFPDVSQLPSHPELPDPLVMFDGSPVRTARDWHRVRKPQLQALFQHYMYGYPPPAPPAGDMKVVVTAEDRNFFGGHAIRRLVDIHCGPEGAPPIHLLLVIPKTPRPAPVFVGLNFTGNHSLLDDPAIPLPTVWMYGRAGVQDNRASDDQRGRAKDTWPIEQIVNRGYAVATFYNGDIDPDTPQWDGIHRYYFKEGQTQPGEHEWGTIAAWAWGLSRVVDYLVTDRALDRRRIAAVGHSRLGKTVLLAAAMDERIALAIPHQAGCGGTAPSRTRSDKAETVKRINDVFPHWFNDTFPKFNEQVDRLPFDQHCLLALVAPRPVLYTNAVEDEWANPAGQFQMMQAADPVYRLLGVMGLSARAMPPPGTLVDSRLGYYIRPGKHSMTAEDWQIFLTFADKHLRAGR